MHHSVGPCIYELISHSQSLRLIFVTPEYVSARVTSLPAGGRPLFPQKNSDFKYLEMLGIVRDKRMCGHSYSQPLGLPSFAPDPFPQP